MQSFYFKNVKISCCNLRTATENVIAYCKQNIPDYVCVTDAGNIVNAVRNFPALKESINNSYMSLPDGRPISIIAKLKGIKNIDRVAGPDFMNNVFEKSQNTGLRHFFLGDTEEILSLLKKKVKSEYGLNAVGSYSPEFGNDSVEENDRIMKIINETSPDIIWVSLGGGRQENWMRNNVVRLNKGVMVGVGAAFRFYLGEIKRAPYFFQRVGLEWLFRLFQQPGKMFKRYLNTLPFFIIYSVQVLFDNKNLKTN